MARAARELSETVSYKDFQQVVAGASKPPKYRNQPQAGYASGHEKTWAEALQWRAQHGEIMGLCLDKRLLRYALVVNGIFIGYYEADAKWIEVATGETVVADAKSDITRKNRDYVIKIKLMHAVHNVLVREL